MIKSLLFLSIIFSGCQNIDDYVYHDNQPPQRYFEKSQSMLSFYHDSKIDILFVIDNSGSMGGIQDNVVRNSALFMDSFLQNNHMEWRLGIISTDAKQSPYLGFTEMFDNEYAKIHTEGFMINTFQGAVENLGTRGSGNEYNFYNILRVMTDYSYMGFFRTDAHLAVIMITDEKEQSLEDFGQKYEVNTFMNAIKSLKNTGKVVRFYGAFEFPDLKDCDDSYSTEYYQSDFENIINLSNGLHMSACTENFGNDLASIGRDIISIGDIPSILLEKRPVVESIKVYYDETPLPSGKEEDGGFWFYSSRYNTINFYNVKFATDLKKGRVNIKFDIDDGVDRD